MRLRTRILLILELLLGLVPVSIFYVYYFPVGLFWTGKVLELSTRGIMDFYTSFVAVAFVAAGIGLVALWVLLVGRLFGRTPTGRLVLAGLVIAIAAGITVLVYQSIYGYFWWLDYYLYGAPLLVAAHQAYTLVRSKRRHLQRALAIGAILMATGLITPISGADGQPRLAAEWEPALGALIVWPPMVPDSLLVEITRDDRLFVMVADQEEKTEAASTLENLGIDPGSVELIIDGTVGWQVWTRDWGPSALFDKDGNFHLVDPQFVGYPYSLPHCDSRLYLEDLFFWGLFGDGDVDPTAAALAQTLGVSHIELPFALTGGNALVDGHGTAFSACVMLNENRRYFGLTEEEFFRSVEARLGIKNYVIVPNFEWFGIQHIDCLLKPLDEETLLVKRVPEGHPDHESIEEIVGLLSGLTTPYGRPYRIVRIDTPPYLMGHHVANYTNSLILNRKVLVPLFGIPGDEEALATFRKAMPGYEVIGFENDGPWGWSWFDALHCRVRAIWDPQMLYMSHKRIDDRVEPAESYPVEVLIRDYSGEGLIGEELKLSWRLRGETDWLEIPLTTGSEPSGFVAAIPGPDAGETVEYFLAAADRSGRQETLPRVAPAGFYSFSVVPRAH